MMAMRYRLQVFAASRTQVNINIRQETRNIDGKAVEGYSYDTVIEDTNSWMYDDDALLQRAINFEADEFLRSTDWYVTRQTETGKPIPAEVSMSRDAARASINRIKDDGTHEIKLIQRDLDGVEIAFCEGDIVPEYGIEITSEEIPKIGQDLNIDIAAFKRSTVKCEDGTEEDFCELDYLQVIPALTKALQKALAEIELLKQSVAAINNT